MIIIRLMLMIIIENYDKYNKNIDGNVINMKER
jgi:hypothetical protein